MKLKIAAAALLTASISATAFPQTGGGDIYKAKCQMCHMADGSGNKGLKVPAFGAGVPDTALISTIKNGKGTSGVKMPAYAGKLTDDQIKAVVVYIHTLEKK